MKDVAFRVNDVQAALDAADKSGAKVARPLGLRAGIHRRLDRRVWRYHSQFHPPAIEHKQFAPGLVNAPGGVEEGEIQFMMIDHIVANVEHMDEWVDYLPAAFSASRNDGISTSTPAAAR